jgi:pimeloyl-ACP methyl ester carboxylesterase
MPLPEQGVVFVADGSGDSRQLSDSLAGVMEQAKVPLRVQRIGWSHGPGRVFLDLYDGDHQIAEGQQLAQEVLAYRRAHPANRICLVGYSAGAGVTLAATDVLPPNTVDEMVLLAPAVAGNRDLRTSLRTCREGIDAFRSDWDVISLVLTPMGMADGFGLPVAGRTGFSIVAQTPQDQDLYQRLRQYSWDGSAKWSGHNGGHYGCINSEFLRAQVVPHLITR